MSTFAAVMTGKGTGAISTIEVFGEQAGAAVREIFKPAADKPATFEQGKILLGKIADGHETIDQVTIGCEGPNRFAIHCHGNPLIVEMIMELLQRHGARLITADQLLAKTLPADQPLNTIAVEAKIAQAAAMTFEGTKLILNQIDAGLTNKAKEWLNGMEAGSLERVKSDVGRILEDSRRARLIIFGCTAVITGPPNTGKSTLMNCLCGRQKAIVTDIKGTTRDWVSARCKIGPLSVELIDTAGLDEELGTGHDSSIVKASQQRAVEILESADLVLLVLDNSQPAGQLEDLLVERIADKTVLTVLNKCDLPCGLDVGRLPHKPAHTVRISAKLGTGVENLVGKIPQVLGAADFDLKSAVCITARQENLLKQLRNAKSQEQVTSIITELLNGRLDV